MYLVAMSVVSLLFIYIHLVLIMHCIRMGGVAQWLARLTRNMSVWLVPETDLSVISQSN